MFNEMLGLILPVDRSYLQRDRLLATCDELATYFAESKLCVEASGYWIRWIDIKLAGDYRDRRRSGLHESSSIQSSAQALPLGGVGDDNSVDVEEPGIPVCEPPVVDAVVGACFSEGEQEGHDGAFAFNDPMGCSLLRQRF